MAQTCQLCYYAYEDHYPEWWCSFFEERPKNMCAWFINVDDVISNVFPNNLSNNKDDVMYVKTISKIEKFSDDFLHSIWCSLCQRGYDPKEMYNEVLTMDDWAELILSEIERRNLGH